LLSEADGNGHRPEVTGDYRIGDVRHVVGDPAGAREALGFTASVGPTDGMVGFATDPLRRPPRTA
jgi:dTDP-L-rhamnose 4-epimerase